jgi:hypothetical protein
MSNTLATFMPPGRAIRSVRPNASVCFLVADEMTLLIEMVVNLAMNRTVGVADLLHRSTIRRRPVGHDGSRLTVSFHEALQKFQRRGPVPPCGDHRLQDVAFVIDGRQR